MKKGKFYIREITSAKLVDGYCTEYDDYAITRDNGAFSVTHIPTGLRVSNTYMSLSECRMFLEESIDNIRVVVKAQEIKVKAAEEELKKLIEKSRKGTHND